MKNKYKFDFSDAVQLNIEDRITRAIEFLTEFSNDKSKTGASEKEISLLESEMGISFPEEYIRFLKMHKYFIFYDGLQIFGIPMVRNGIKINKKPYKFGKRFYFGGKPYLKYPKYFSYLDNINGPIYRSGPEPFAPSFSLSLWRMCKERKEKIELEFRQAKEIVEFTEGIIEFNIMEFLEDENLPGTIKVISYDDGFTRNHIIDGEQVVILDKEIIIQFDYPLNKEVYFMYENESGFTRLDLFQCIFEGYKKIYDGTYEIWGHSLGELYLEGVWYFRRERTLHLRIGS